jgi:hypothetical protein
MAKSKRETRPTRFIRSLSPEQVVYWRQHLEPMILRSVETTKTRLRAAVVNRGSERGELLDELTRHGLVYRWNAGSPLRLDCCYVPTYAGCLFAGLSTRAAASAWRAWLLLHPKHEPGWATDPRRRKQIRDRGKQPVIDAKERDLMLLEFLANLCHYAQAAPQLADTGTGEKSERDRRHLLSLVSFQVACFLASYTVEGTAGVDYVVVLDDLVGEPRTFKWWRNRMRRLVREHGGFLDPKLGSLHTR